ncbi:MAG: LamG domain-containing protein [Chloroflexi bacterium]|nr:LamG domain-containing protein [Chloroflexota bacterium]
MNNYSPPQRLLELPFDGSFTGTDGEAGTASGVTFTAGYDGLGALFDENDTLFYAAGDNINREQGSIEFWLKPHWDGNDGQNYVFFEIGTTWFNRMRITKDGANNFRFMVWSADTEYDAAYNVSGWQADEWHHVRVTWEEDEIALYLDGILRNVETGITLPASLDSVLYLGSSSGGSVQAQAVMDEFAIYTKP